MKSERKGALVSLDGGALAGAAEVSSKQKRGYQNDHELLGPWAGNTDPLVWDCNSRQNIVACLRNKLRYHKVSSLQIYS